jgi:hypothetical protein
MLEKIRLATEEEVKSIAAESDLTPMSRVMVMEEMKAVWKVCNELDPVFYNGASHAKMYKFIWGIENIMKGAGVTEYYFQVPVKDEAYLKIVEHFGGQRVSKEPEFRYKVTI